MDVLSLLAAEKGASFQYLRNLQKHHALQLAHGLQARAWFCVSLCCLLYLTALVGVAKPVIPMLTLVSSPHDNFQTEKKGGVGSDSDAIGMGTCLGLF